MEHVAKEKFRHLFKHPTLGFRELELALWEEGKNTNWKKTFEVESIEDLQNQVKAEIEDLLEIHRPIGVDERPETNHFQFYSKDLDTCFCKTYLVEGWDNIMLNLNP